MDAIIEEQEYLIFRYDSAKGGYILIGVGDLFGTEDKAMGIPQSHMLEIPDTWDDGVNGRKNVIGIGQYVMYSKRSSDWNVNPVYETYYNLNSLTGMKMNENVTQVVIPATVTTIDTYAFATSTKVTHLTIGSGVKTIGDNAFDGMTALTNINYWAVDAGNKSENNYVFRNAGTGASGIALSIGSAVTKIPEYLFFPGGTYPNLKTLSFDGDNSSFVIGKYAFYNSSLTSALTLPTGTTSVGEFAFYSSNSIPSINIPSKVNSDATISVRAFSECSGATSITIGNGVKTIGNYAFTGCSNATSLSLGTAVSSIGNYAFANCSKITSITIPNSTGSIGQYAFDGCSAATSLTIGLNVSSIGSNAFANMTALTTINYNAKSVTDKSSNNGVFTKAGQSGNGIKLVIGNQVKSIPAFLFYPSTTTSNAPKITSIEFTATSVCESIGENAFNGVSALAGHVNIPNSVETIGANAFYGCSGITTLTIGTGVTSIGNYAFFGTTAITAINYNAINVADKSADSRVFSQSGKNGTGITLTIGNAVTRIPACLFAVGSAGSASTPKITKITFAETSVCESIGEYAFLECVSITNPVTLPNSVTTIEQHAFNACSGITTLTLGTGVTTIGNYAFANMTGLTTVNYNATSAYDLSNTVIPFSSSGASSVTLYIGSNVTRIPSYMFKDFSKIVTIQFKGTSCTEFATGAFEGATGVTNIYYVGSMDSWFANDFVTVSSNPTYASNKAVLWVTDVGASAYDSSNSANSTTFGGSTYRKVYRIVSPSSVTTINKYLFINLKQFTEIWVSNNVTTIGESAYSGLVNATLVVLPSSISIIGSSAFASCSKVANVYYKGSIDSWVSVDMSNSGSNPIGASTVTRNFWVGSTGRSANVDGNTGYAQHNGVSYYKVVNYYTTRTLLTINSYAFANWTQLRMLIIEDTLRSIEDSAFNGTSGITTIYYKQSEAYKNANLSIGSSNAGITATSVTWKYWSTYFKYTAIDGTSARFDGFYPAFASEFSSYNQTLFDLYFTGLFDNADSSNAFRISGSWYVNSGSSLPVVTVGDGTNIVGIANYFDAYILSENIATISANAFNFTGFTKIWLPNSLVRVQANAFSSSLALPNVYFNGSMDSYLGVTFTSNNYMFKSVTTLWTASAGSSTTDGSTTYKSTSFVKVVGVVCPTSISSISAYAFIYLKQITSLTLSTTVTTIGDSAFNSCRNLSTITFKEGLISIGASAFQNIKVSSLAFPNSLVTINGWAFAINSSLTTVSFGTGLTTIGDSAFYLNAISSDLDFASTALTTIGPSAFAGNGTFSKVYIPSTITTIWNNVLHNSNTTIDIYLNGSVTKWINAVQARISAKSFSLYVSDVEGNSYSGEHTYKSVKYYKITELYLGQNNSGSYDTIGTGDFEGNIAITRLEIDRSGITTIQGGAFAYCTSLNLIRMRETVTSISTTSFTGCTYGTGNAEASAPKFFYEGKKGYGIASTSSLMPSNWYWYDYYGVTYTVYTAVGITPYYCWSSIALRSSAHNKSITVLGDFFMKNGAESNSANTYIATFTASSITSFEGEGAFYDATSLVTVSMTGYSGSTIPNKTFRNCQSLTTFYFGGTNYTLDASINNMLPAAVTAIGSYAFYNTTSLTTIGFNYLLTSIGQYAFANSNVNSIYYNQIKNYKTCNMTIYSNNTPMTTEKNWIYYQCSHYAKAYSYTSTSADKHTRYTYCHYCQALINTETNLDHSKKYSHVTGASGDACHHVWCDTEPGWVSTCKCGNISRHYTFNGCAYDDTAEKHTYDNPATNSNGVCKSCGHTCTHSSQYTVYSSNDKEHSRHDVCNYCDLDNRNVKTENHTYNSSYTCTFVSDADKNCGHTDWICGHVCQHKSPSVSGGDSTHTAMTFTEHKVNSTQHWDRWDCAYCDYYKNKSTANHGWYWTWNTSQHWQACSGCSSSGCSSTHGCSSTQNYENHTLKWVDQGSSGCRQECIDPDGDVCGYYTTTTAHQWTYSDNANGTHNRTCSRCSRIEKNISHTLKYDSITNTTHREYCRYCSYSKVEGHVWNSSYGCDECGKTCGHESKSYWYSDNGSDANHTKTQKCDYCNKSISSTTESHSYGSDNVCDSANPNGTKCGHTCAHSSTNCVKKSSQTYHDLICKYCSYDVGDHAHVWSSGSCTHCSYVCNHNWSSWSSNGSSTHSRTCSNCGKKETENHDWNDWTTGNTSNHTRTCKDCSKSSSESHDWSDWTYYDHDQHYRSCDTCGRTAYEDHSWSDGYCSTCDNHCSHDWVWKTNGDLTASGHTRTCSYCGDSEFGVHTWGGDHGYTCTVCLAVCNYCDNFSDLVYAGNVGHTSGTMIHQSKYKCSNCNYTKTVDENCEDYKVSASGYNSGVYNSSTHQVWTAKCSRCGWGWLSNVAHSFSYTYVSRSESVAGKIYTHTKYYSCGCGYSGSTVEDCPTENITPSSYTSNNDGTHYALTQRCQNRCGWGRRTTSACYLPWSSDSSEHWKQCGYCYYVSSRRTSHSWSGWKIDESSSQHYKACTACGREKDRTNCTWSGIWPAQKCSVCGNYRIDGGGIPNFDGVLTPTGLLTVAGDDNHKQVGALKPPESLSKDENCDDCDLITYQIGDLNSHFESECEFDCEADELCQIEPYSCEDVSCKIDYSSAICKENSINSLGGWDYEIVNGETLVDSFVIKPANDNEEIYQDETLNNVGDKYSITAVTLDSTNNVSKNDDVDEKDD